MIFRKSIILVALLSLFAFGIVGCSHDADSHDADSHDHSFAAEWVSDEVKHWHASTCGHDVKSDEAAHVWDHEIYQFDDASGTNKRTCTVCGKVLSRKTDFNPYSSPIDADTGLAATASSGFIYFGVFPQTVLPFTSNVIVDERDYVTMGTYTYYKGSDGNYYAKVKENAYDGSDAQKYTDGTQANLSGANTYRYFKVEPIKWKVLTSSYNGRCLLLAENILTANVPYNVSTSNRTIGGSTVYANNYKYSTIRAYLNGKYEGDDTQEKNYADKGFLQTAFTESARNLIAVTSVDNSAESTSDAGNNITQATSYVCADTLDKIFLLSEKEATSSGYGFAAYNSAGLGNTRIRVTTDFAKANFAYQDATAGYGGYWWLRSPFYTNSGSGRVHFVYGDGRAHDNSYVGNTYNGGVPALSISLQ